MDLVTILSLPWLLDSTELINKEGGTTMEVTSATD